MHPSPRFLVSALFTLNWGITDVYATFAPPAESLSRRGNIHRMTKRQIRNADYATNAPPKPLDPSRISTNSTLTTSADTAKAAHMQMRSLQTFRDFPAFVPSELHSRDLYSPDAFWKRTIDSRDRLLNERASAINSAAKDGPQSANPDSSLSVRTARNDGPWSKKKQQDVMLARHVNEDIRSAWMKKRAAHYATPHHNPRHIFKHEYYTRVSVMKHTLPSRRSPTGASLEDAANARRDTKHSRRYD